MILAQPKLPIDTRKKDLRSFIPLGGLCVIIVFVTFCIYIIVSLLLNMSKWVNQFRSKVKKIIPHSKGKRVLDETYDLKDTLGG